MAPVSPIDITAPDAEIAALLNPLCAADAAKFQRVVAIVKQANRHTRPLFPASLSAAAVAPLAAADVAAFTDKYIDASYLKDWDCAEAKKRLQRNGRVTQYLRWNWALANSATYVNMLRVSGHSDQKIADMLTGVPMCFAGRAAFDELRAALKQLAAEIAEEMDWTNVGFVFTGSSVPGFSQNPMKGMLAIPSRITSASKSDVDICIVADGVNATVARCHSDGDEFIEPKWAYPTTVSELASGMRFGCKDLHEFCKSAAKFYDVWSKKLPGGLQFTFCEDDTDIPPWEARVDIKSI